LLASASADQTICLWDVHKQALAARLKGHLYEVWAVAFDPDGKTLLSADKEGLVKCWRVPSAKTKLPEELRLQDFSFLYSNNRGFAFTPDGREILTLHGPAQSVTRRTLPSLQAAGTVDALGTNNYLLASSPALGLAAVLDWDGMLKIWSFERQAILTNYMIGAGGRRSTLLAFAPATRRLLALLESKTVVLWDLDPWKQIASWDFQESVFGPFSVSPDGRFLARGGNELVVYSCSNGAIVSHFAAHRFVTDSVAFSPDGTLLATGSQEGLAKLWRTDSWQEVATLRGHLLGVHSLAFSADSRRLATGSHGSEAVKVWDLATMQEVLNLSGPGDLIFWLGFSPDGRTLLGLGTKAPLQCWFAPLIGELPPIANEL